MRIDQLHIPLEENKLQNNEAMDNLISVYQKGKMRLFSAYNIVPTGKKRCFNAYPLAALRFGHSLFVLITF